MEATHDAYVARMVDVFREVRRVLRDDGTCWVNLGDSYASGEIGRHDHAQAAGLCAGDSAAGRARIGDGMGERQQRKMRTGLPAKNLVGIPWRVAFALQADGWYLRSDIIWCLSGGTRVYARTQKGEMAMTIKDMARLRPGTVELWNGARWTRVLGCSETQRPPAPLEIVLRSGERVTCTPDHEWPTARGLVRACELQIGDVIATTVLPEPANPRRPAHVPDDVGWFVGLFVAEGSMSAGTIQISGHVRETDMRMTRIAPLVAAYGGTVRAHNIGGNGATINIKCRLLRAVLDTYVGGRVARDKTFRVACWARSNAFLRSLLDGYLDGDGHYDAQNNRWRIGFCRNYALESGLRTLCARIGARLRLKPSVARFDGRRFPSFRGEVRFAESDHHNAKNAGEVVSIRGGRARKFWDVGVSDEPHVFALASGLLTHNSKPCPMPESVTDRPTKAHEYVFLLTKSKRYAYDADAVREEWADERAGFSGSVRSKYEGRVERMDGGLVRAPRVSGRNARTVWTIASEPYADAHFAVFPSELPRRCVLAGCPRGGVVLDPFTGSGTTGIVALKLGRAFVGIELNPTYAAMARERIGAISEDTTVKAQRAGQVPLFGKGAT